MTLEARIDELNVYIIFHKGIDGASSREDMLVRFASLTMRAESRRDFPHRIWDAKRDRNLDLRSVFAECLAKNLIPTSSEP